MDLQPKFLAQALQHVDPVQIGRARLRSVATKYAGKPLAPFQQAFNEPLMQQMAQHFDAAVHNPKNPATIKAYKAYVGETKAQYKALQKAGYKFTPTDNSSPYKDVGDLQNDVFNNKHLYVYNGDHPQHELISPEDNLKLRATHDMFGHARNNFDFSAQGEMNAFRAHAQMYGPEARKALASDLLGQAAWTTYFGNGTFPEQKAALMPEASWHPLLD